MLAVLTALGAAIECVRALRDPNVESRERYRWPLLIALGALIIQALAQFVCNTTVVAR
jgi:hypothetical protein